MYRIIITLGFGGSELNPPVNKAIQIRDQNYSIKLLSISIVEQKRKNMTLLI